MINILIISDQEILKDDIKSWVKAESEIKLAGSVNKNIQVLRNIKEMNPDIIIIEIDEEDKCGQEIIENINKTSDSNKILVLYPAGMEKDLFKFHEAGTKGFLVKNSGQDDFIIALKKLYKDKKYICTEFAMQILQRVREQTSIPLKTSVSPGISKREMEVLHLISDGFTNNEIANKLFTSRRTVETHRKNLIEKTDTKNTAHLIKYAVNNGIIKENS